ncbi:hypothetical protein E6C64_15525 [Naasia lichenicola]|uniref:Asp23/Gls24 family envelope stress response protein n=2 Tax=Naasia lichenicola TaxID=2565933 RepID=A0A4S4FJH8_9MICO|nr:hypothetical protein E6C64_15525 [Naasia lichenicola]
MMPPGDSPLDEQNLDGHTIEELSDYLDNGRQPTDQSIESSAGAQNALAALSRLRALAPRILEAEAKAAPVRDASWFKRLLDQIGVQAHAGREIPIRSDHPEAQLSITEGAVRAIVRAVGDEIDGVLVERCRLDGDVETSGEPVSVVIDVSIYADAEASSVIDELRRGVESALSRHTELNVSGVDIVVRDFEKDPEED